MSVTQHRTLPLRLRWVLRALGRNPLIRVSDRLEACAVLMVFVVGLLAIPAASEAGDNAYDARMRIVDEQMRTRHAVDAVAVGTSVATPGRYTRPGPVRVEWREGGQTRTETVPSSTTVSPGETVTVWLDETNQVVSAPDTPQVVRSVAAGRAWTVWLSAVAAAVGLAAAARFALDRARTRAWEREIHLLAHNDDGWADRHS